MVAPLRLKGSETAGPNSQNPSYPVGTKIYGLQEMSSSEIQDGIIYRLLKEFAKVDTVTPKTGDITDRDTVGDVANMNVGVFSDTDRVNDVGARAAIATLSRVTTLERNVYQVLNTVSGTITRPVCWRDGGAREMTDQEIFDTIIDPALNRMTNRGLGSYHFSNGTPKDPTAGTDLPGTWTSVFELTDKYKTGVVPSTSAATFTTIGATRDSQTNEAYFVPGVTTTASIAFYTVVGSNTNTTTRYTLWRKTEEASPPTTLVRPLKFANTSDRGKHLVEMTNAEILSLLIPFRNAIVNNGKGRYLFQQSSPTSGTWARRGDAIVDMLNVLSEGSYTWGYAKTYTNSFTGYYTSYYTGYYTGAYATRTSAFFGGREEEYTGEYFGGPRVKTFAQSYTRNKQAGFAATGMTTYTTAVVSALTLVESTDYLWVKRAN